ncbi:MAG: type I-E CRISPR-associated protein Cse2/CasB, partial [Clostridiales Family XIII bacterium]|nr:type I-E CRISPR-associated protein Cse2/CasB [Clostridiales Family XIII bacterium]
MSEVEKLTKFTKVRLDWFQSDDGEKRGGERRAALARLRLGVGKEAGTVPETWKYIYEGFPDELAGKGDAPSYAENAIHAALTLYAMHAQGKGNPRVHDGNAGSIGMALNNLKRKNLENEQGILRRFNALVTAKTADEINLHARGVIQLLKQGEIK